MGLAPSTLIDMVVALKPKMYAIKGPEMEVSKGKGNKIRHPFDDFFSVLNVPGEVKYQTFQRIGRTSEYQIVTSLTKKKSLSCFSDKMNLKVILIFCFEKFQTLIFYVLVFSGMSYPLDAVWNGIC